MSVSHESSGRALRAPHRVNELTVQVIVVLAILAALIVATRLTNQNFFKPDGLRSLSRVWAIASLLALRQAVVIIGGGIDLSIGSLVAFCGAFALKLLDWGYSLPLGLALSLGSAWLIGLANGLLICRLQLQPFLVTLCSLLIFRSIARVLTGGSTVTYDADRDPLLYTLGSGSWFGVPIPVFILLAVILPLGFFLWFTVPGRHLFATGGNLEAARFSGIRVNLLRTASYMICSSLAAVAAVIEAGNVNSVTPSSAGNAYEMYAITAAVLGGCALSGGQGSLIGVVAGVAILRLLPTTVVFFNLSDQWTLAITGLVLLAAVIADALVKRRRARR